MLRKKNYIESYNILNMTTNRKIKILKNAHKLT